MDRTALGTEHRDYGPNRQARQAGRQAGQAGQAGRTENRLLARAVYQLIPRGPTPYNARFTKPEGSDIHSHTPGDPTRGGRRIQEQNVSCTQQQQQ